MASLLEAIPWYLLEEIALNLDYADVCNLMQTSKTCYSILSANHFWRRYVQTNTCLTETRPDEDYRTLFKIVFSERYKKAVVDMNVVWLNDHYLKRKKNEDSFVGDVVRLNSVCWLDIRTSFPDVHPGEYDVIWNMKFKSPDVSDQSTFGVEWEGGKKEVTWQEEDWNRRSCRVFRDFKLATITITKETEVKLYLYNHGGSWKSGVSWDYVQLKPTMFNIKKKGKVKLKSNLQNERYKRAVAYMDVVWLDREHLVKRRQKDSYSGEIVVLEHVCWLDIKTTFSEVEPSKYDVIWRMKLNEARIPSQTVFKVSSDYSSDQVVWEAEDWRRKARENSGWQEFHLGSITLTRSTDVTVCMYNHSGDWKSGVKWDYVHLRPVESGISDQASPASKV